MDAPKTKDFAACIVASIAILGTQLVGYNVVTLGVLVFALSLLFSPDTLVRQVRVVPAFISFLLLSIASGTYFVLCDGVTMWTVMYWGQFYFFCFALLAVRDKPMLFRALTFCVYAIFAADLFTNLLLLAGVHVPWSELPNIRPGETMSRFTGVKGNTLYSGSISFIAIALFLEEQLRRRWLYFTILVLMVLNLCLAGSFRYLIVFAVVVTMRFLPFMRRKIFLPLMYAGSIIIVILATRFTMFLSLSNFYRYMIWDYFVSIVLREPWIGHGYHCIHLDDSLEYSINSLIASGVTESCVLLVAFNFGIIVLALFLFSIICTLLRTSHYRRYTAQASIFVGLTLDLFWGGSFDNALSLCLMLLAWYIINADSRTLNANEAPLPCPADTPADLPGQAEDQPLPTTQAD